MNFAKKYPIFFAVCIVSAISLIAGLVLNFMSLGRLSAAEKKIRSAKAQLESVQSATPSPVVENIEILDSNIADLELAFAEALSRLESKRPLELAEDADVLLPTILKYIRDFKVRAVETDYIIVSTDESFGFSTYVTNAPPPAKDKVPLVDKQRQILTYLVQRLFDSASDTSPIEIVSIAREYVEEASAAPSANNRRRSNNNRPDRFVVDPAVTARVTNAVDTMAFQIKFKGYTESLRLFIESLTAFDLPIVVRSVEVVRTKEDANAAASAASERNAQTNSLNSLFGGLDASSSSASEPVETAPEVIVDQNKSEFTVTVEFIEVVLQAQKTQAEEEAL